MEYQTSGTATTFEVTWRWNSLFFLTGPHKTVVAERAVKLRRCIVRVWLYGAALLIWQASIDRRVTLSFRFLLLSTGCVQRRGGPMTVNRVDSYTFCDYVRWSSLRSTVSPSFSASDVVFHSYRSLGIFATLVHVVQSWSLARIGNLVCVTMSMTIPRVSFSFVVECLLFHFTCCRWHVDALSRNWSGHRRFLGLCTFRDDSFSVSFCLSTKSNVGSCVNVVRFEWKRTRMILRVLICSVFVVYPRMVGNVAVTPLWCSCAAWQRLSFHGHSVFASLINNGVSIVDGSLRIRISSIINVSSWSVLNSLLSGSRTIFRTPVAGLNAFPMSRPSSGRFVERSSRWHMTEKELVHDKGLNCSNESTSEQLSMTSTLKNQITKTKSSALELFFWDTPIRIARNEVVRHNLDAGLVTESDFKSLPEDTLWSQSSVHVDAFQCDVTHTLFVRANVVW